jgi:hypothetical protein
MNSLRTPWTIAGLLVAATFAALYIILPQTFATVLALLLLIALAATSMI